MFPPSNQAHKQRITILNNFDPQNPVDDSSKQRSPKQVQFVDPKAMPKESRLQWKTSTPTENNQIQTTQMNHQQQFQRETQIKQAEFQDHGVILEENEEDSSQQNTSHNENYIEDQQNQEIKDSDQIEPIQQQYFEHNNFEQPARNLVLTNQLEISGNNEAHVGIQQGHPLSAIKQSIRSRLEQLETRIVEEGQSNSNLRTQINQMEDAITETASELDDFSHYSRSAKATSTKQTPRMLGERDEYNFVSGSKSQKRISEQLSIGNSADKEIAEVRENNNNTEKLTGIIPNSFSFRLREKQQEEDQFKKYYEEANKKINDFTKDSGAQREQQQLARTNLLPPPKSPENRDYGRYQKPQNNNQDKQRNVRPSTMRSNVNNRNQLSLQESQSFSRDKGYVNSLELKNYLEEDLNRSKEQQNQLFNIRNSIKQGLKMLKESIPVNDENDGLILKPNIETIEQVVHKHTLNEQILGQEPDKSKQQEEDEAQEQIKQLQQKLLKYEEHLLPNQDQSEGEQLFQTKQNDFRSKTTSNVSDFSENEKNKRNDKDFIGKYILNQEKKGIVCGRLQVKSIKDYSAAEEAEQEMRKIEKEGEEYQKQLQQRKKEIEGKEAEARLQRTIADCIRVYTEQRNDKLAQTRQQQQDKQDIECSPTRIQSYLLNPPRQQQTSKIREIISRKVHSWLNQSVDNLAPKNSRIQIKQHQLKSMKAS